MKERVGHGQTDLASHVSKLSATSASFGQLLTNTSRKNQIGTILTISGTELCKDIFFGTKAPIGCKFRDQIVNLLLPNFIESPPKFFKVNFEKPFKTVRHGQHNQDKFGSRLSMGQGVRYFYNFRLNKQLP